MQEWAEIKLAVLQDTTAKKKKKKNAAEWGMAIKIVHVFNASF